MTLVANAVALVMLVSVITQAGGTVNLVQATFGLTPMRAAAPDRTEVYNSTATGDDLSVAIYEPTTTEKLAPTILYIHGGGWTTGTPTDMDRLAFWGDSAGGNLAINVGGAAARGDAASSCSETVPAPAAVLTDFPGVSVASIYNTKWAVTDPSVFGTLYTGGSPEQYPDRYAAIDSSTYISPEGPPTLVMTAGRDELVHPSFQEKWVQEARAAGMEVEHVTIPLTQHTYTQVAGGSIAAQGHLTIGENFLARNLR